MGIRKGNPVLGQFVNVRSMDFRFGIKGRDVSITQIIRQLNTILGVCAFTAAAVRSTEEIVISLFIY